MNITEVRVKLMRQRSDRLRAFCSITIDDDFVVHDLRVIEGRKGFFVAMPSRKLSSGCPNCGSKNPLRAKYCGDCGKSLPSGRDGAKSRDKLHVDVAHPINTECREMLQSIVLEAYEQEEEKARQGMVEESAEDEDDYDVDDYDLDEDEEAGKEEVEAEPAETAEQEEEPVQIPDFADTEDEEPVEEETPARARRTGFMSFEVEDEERVVLERPGEPGILGEEISEFGVHEDIEEEDEVEAEDAEQQPAEAGAFAEGVTESDVEEDVDEEAEEEDHEDAGEEEEGQDEEEGSEKRVRRSRKRREAGSGSFGEGIL